MQACWGWGIPAAEQMPVIPVETSHQRSVDVAYSTKLFAMSCGSINPTRRCEWSLTAAQKRCPFLTLETHTPQTIATRTTRCVDRSIRHTIARCNNVCASQSCKLTGRPATTRSESRVTKPVTVTCAIRFVGHVTRHAIAPSATRSASRVTTQLTQTSATRLTERKLRLATVMRAIPS